MEIGQGVAEKSRAQKLKKIIIRKKKTLMTQDNLDMWFMKSKKKKKYSSEYFPPKEVFKICNNVYQRKI